MTPPIPENGWIAVVKRDCPTCALIAPLLATEAHRIAIACQDDANFPDTVSTVIDDRELAWSHELGIEIVPTLIRRDGGAETGRTVGWHRDEWQTLLEDDHLGADLPASQPGCGSRTQEPGMAEKLAVRFGDVHLSAREISLGAAQDPIEACFDRDWSDGLPVVPPTPERVLAMLGGANLDGDRVLGMIPPAAVPCTVEKAAINAVMAGCRPEYFPVVLTALEAALDPEFGLHSVLVGTGASGPVIVANGPIVRGLGLNAGANVLGPGHRANLTIGRALQLICRNIGGAKPGSTDASVLGHPGKLSFCIAEREDEPSWDTLSTLRGIAPGKSAVTLFSGDGMLGLTDQKSANAESLVRNLALSLKSVGGAKKAGHHHALVVVCPQHRRLFVDAGWTKQMLIDELEALLQLPAAELAPGSGGITDGTAAKTERIAKFRPDGIHVICAGGDTGSMSAIIPCSGEHAVNPVTKEINP
ncbi:MAG TPA: thioredoxin [Rhodospirillaceae bacterium]|nr:thioredoxin [Rhodospirillaceae bacterium]